MLACLYSNLICQPMSLKIKNLALLDESNLFEKILKKYLLDPEPVNVVIQATDGVDLFTKLSNFDVDILLTDISVNQKNMCDIIAAIRQSYPKIRILVLSMNTDISTVSELVDMGIHGYISKKDDPEELVQAIRLVANGMIYRNKIFTEALYWNKQHNVKPAPDKEDILLSDREKDLLQLLWSEKSNREIAEHFFLSVRSVEKMRQHMKEKLGIRSTIGLLKYAIDKKIIIRENNSGQLFITG